MAEEESELELDRFKKELESLLNDECGLQSKSYCARFCELVEEYTGQWQVPLPQLQVLRSALCAFVRGAASFPSDCEHVRYTLSSLALSVFELLLFFGRDEFPEDPLKDILDSFQECHSSLVRYQNVYLLQVRHIIRDGGPWASPVLEGILKEVEQQQEEVDRYLGSEVSMFFELRVRYLLACERTREAMALALKCSQHPTAGRRLFFKQAYLSCLWKSSQQERLIMEMAEIDGKDAVEILCIAENEEKDELLLELSRGFLLQQLRSGDMYYLWDLVFIWCKLYLRVKATEKHFLQECKLLLLSATNVKAIFPFMKVILSEHPGKEGLTFCVELCAQALQTDLKNDPVTKSLIYKTIAYLFPNDLEICRACALLLFFLERTVEAYKTVFFLYNHPDLEYHLDTSPIGNNVRFEVIQILKKGLFFDPEFWSLLNIKTNCLKLMSDEVARAALREITEEDKWGPSYCVLEHCKCRAEPERTVIRQEAKSGSRDKQESGTVEKRVMSPSADASSEAPQYKRRGRKPGSRITKNLEPFPVRRSFRQLDLAQNHARQLNNRCQRFLTRQTEKNILKRRGRKPRWLLEQLAALGENSAPGQRKKPGRKPKLFSSLKEILVDTPVIEITMEYSYPDNEVELPADVQGRSASKMTSSTERRFDQPQTTPCSKTPNSLLQILLEKSPHLWRDKEDSQPQDVMIVIRKFHTYAKVPEEEESPSLDRLTDTAVLTAPHAVKQEEDFQVLAPVKNLSEPVEGTKVTSLTAAVTQEIPGVSDGSDLSLLSPVEQAVVPDSKITTTVNPPKDQTASIMTDNIQALEITQEVSNLGNTTDKATDYICTTSEKGTDIISTSENAPNTTPELAPQSKVSTPKEIPDTHENPPEVTEVIDASKNASAAEIILKTPAVLEEVQPQEPASQQTAEVEPSQNSSSSPVSSAQTTVQPKHQCKLCNKMYETPLSHALWHYRTEKKCMFCDKLALTRGALQHFQKHIKDLSRVEGPLETKKCEDVPQATGSPDQTVQESPPKKAKPGFAQIKSRLLMRLKLTRKAQPQREPEKSSDNSGTPLKETDTKKHASAPEQKESSTKDDKQSVPQETIRYLTRGSVRKSEHKGRLCRTKLGRKGKTRRVMAGGDSSAPKDGSVHRVNGVIRKKRKMWCIQAESSRTTDKNVPPVKEEKKTDAEKSEKIIRSNKAHYDIRTKAEKATSNNIGGESKNCAKAKALEEPRVKKKKLREDEEKVDIKAVKKRKNEEGTSTAKSTDTKEKKNSVPNVEKQQNGAEAESSETSKTVRKRKGSSTPAVSCPIDTCTFQAMPGPVLSHVLIHHPGDTKALEFFYNLAAKKCLFCARRIWTAQHFFDHIVSHRGNLKHPCYHVACQKRFKTRLGVGDHMEKDHNPLKAGCCFPGCTVESASPKDLYSHEKSHYKSVTSEKDVDKPSLSESRVKSTPAAAQQTAESVATEAETPSPPPPLPPPPLPPGDIMEQKKSPAPVTVEDEKPLTLNRSSVNYSSKSSRLVNGHTDHAQESSIKAPPTAPKEQEPKYEKVAVKPFSRLPPSAYLDELYLSMPKKWRGPQASTKGSDADDVVPVKRQSCSRCNAAFDCEEELQLHREKCTSLFGFDSDDENAS
ncbi:hypothetical protein PGIGA_G00162300 [Pangasianodon gigas]|uniref:Uncharacterized protein n=1 Tax=Pangasianodon gigas TaxID=30993 RepID=A0ACC5XRK3_PANGG|nr:hypothetical protein [Pangasianodon gigas]